MQGRPMVSQQRDWSSAMTKGLDVSGTRVLLGQCSADDERSSPRRVLKRRVWTTQNLPACSRVIVAMASGQPCRSMEHVFWKPCSAADVVRMRPSRVCRVPIAASVATFRSTMFRPGRYIICVSSQPRSWHRATCSLPETAPLHAQPERPRYCYQHVNPHQTTEPLRGIPAP